MFSGASLKDIEYVRAYMIYMYTLYICVTYIVYIHISVDC
jgi:hypothetical protein